MFTLLPLTNFSFEESFNYLKLVLSSILLNINWSKISVKCEPKKKIQSHKKSELLNYNNCFAILEFNIKVFNIFGQWRVFNYVWMVERCESFGRTCVSTGAVGTWQTRNFRISRLALEDFEILVTNCFQRALFYKIDGTCSFKFLTKALFGQEIIVLKHFLTFPADF